MNTETTDPNGSTIEHKQSELREIRSELREKQPWIPDEETALYQQVSEWILASHDLPMGSIQARVQSRLMALQETPKHKLRPHRGVNDPEEAFPDDCEGCTHYGKRCPVLANKLGRDTLERHYDEAESDEDLLGRLSQFASRKHCDILKAEIESGQTQYRQFVKKGERLRARVNAAVSDIDLSGLDEDAIALGENGELSGAETGPSMGEFPSEEVAEKVAAVTEQITSDDEEGESNA